MKKKNVLKKVAKCFVKKTVCRILDATTDLKSINYASEFHNSFQRLSYIRAAGSGLLAFVGLSLFQHLHTARRFFCAHPFHSPLFFSLQNNDK